MSTKSAESEKPGSASEATGLHRVETQSDRMRRAWSVVERSRHAQRPHAIDYLHRIFEEFEEFKGDRAFGEDSALLSGAGILKSPVPGQEGMKVFFLAHEKGRNTKQKIERNFGMARPEGYRKAVRMMDLAERFNRPIVALIDTPGAFPGIGAEERGQSEAIASSILRLLEVNVPTVGAVIGEGGSGGALAIGVTDRLLMLENSIYSVISPESCAAILWENSGEAKQAASALKMSAREGLDLGICDEVVPEGAEGAHANPESVASLLLERIDWHLRKLLEMDPAKRLDARFRRYRQIDARHIIQS